MASASSHLPLGRLLILSIAMIYRTWQRLGVDLLYDLPLAKTMKLSVHQHTRNLERCYEQRSGFQFNVHISYSATTGGKGSCGSHLRREARNPASIDAATATPVILTARWTESR